MRQASFALLAVCCLTASAMARTQSADYGISVIVVSTRDEADELRRQLQAGASFEVLATRHSIDPTAEKGGYMGTRDRLNPGPTVRSALEELAPGGASAVIGTGNAFLLLKRATPQEDRWRTSFDAGVDALRRGRSDSVALLDASVRLAESMGSQDIRVAESLNGLSEAHHRQGDWERAERTAQRSLAILNAAFGESHRATLPGLERLAATLQASGDFGEAERIYRRILSVRWIDSSDRPPSASSDLLDRFAAVLSLAYTRDPRLEAAIERFRSSVSQPRLNRDLYVALRDGLMSVSLVAEAEAVMLAGVRTHPDSRQLRYQLAEFYEESKKYGKALETFEEAVKLGPHPDPSEEGRQLGLIYEKIAAVNIHLVRFDDALDAVRRGEQVDPVNPRLRLLEGDLHLRRNRFDAAMTAFRQANGIAGEIAAAHEGLAQAHLTQGRFAESVKEAEAALALDPAQQRSRYVLGTALIRSGQTREGRKTLEDHQRAAEKRRTETAARLAVDDIGRTVSSELAAFRLTSAMGLLKAAVDAHPSTAVLRLQLALLQGRLDLHREAVSTLLAMIRLKLDNFLVHRAIAAEYEILGDVAASRRHRAIYLQKLDAGLQADVQ